MAGILYLLRLFVYHVEETETVVKNRFEIMERRLLKYITAPAMVAAFIFGVWMLALNPELLKQRWMHAKLCFVVCLVAVTMYAGSLRRQLAKGSQRRSSFFFRVLNEVPTLLMILIVLLVILRPF